MTLPSVIKSNNDYGYIELICVMFQANINVISPTMCDSTPLTHGRDWMLEHLMQCESLQTVCTRHC